MILRLSRVLRRRVLITLIRLLGILEFAISAISLEASSCTSLTTCKVILLIVLLTLMTLLLISFRMLFIRYCLVAATVLPSVIAILLQWAVSDVWVTAIMLLLKLVAVLRIVIVDSARMTEWSGMMVIWILLLCKNLVVVPVMGAELVLEGSNSVLWVLSAAIVWMKLCASGSFCGGACIVMVLDLLSSLVILGLRVMVIIIWATLCGRRCRRLTRLAMVTWRGWLVLTLVLTVVLTELARMRMPYRLLLFMMIKELFSVLRWSCSVGTLMLLVLSRHTILQCGFAHLLRGTGLRVMTILLDMLLTRILLARILISLLSIIISFPLLVLIMFVLVRVGSRAGAPVNVLCVFLVVVWVIRVMSSGAVADVSLVVVSVIARIAFLIGWSIVVHVRLVV